MDLANFERYSSAGAPALSGATVKLRAATMTNANAGTVVATTTTSAEGYWSFTGVADGDYDVEVVVSASYSRWYKGFAKHAISAFRAPGIWQRIDRRALVASAPTIDFVQIPVNFKDLRLVVRARTDNGVVVDEGVQMRLSTNTTVTPTPDTGANYHYNQVNANNSAIATAPAIGQTLLPIGTATANGGTVASYFGFNIVELPDYLNAVSNKGYMALAGATNHALAAYPRMLMYVGDWVNTGQIRQIRLFPATGPNFVAGTTVELWAA